MGDVSAEQNDLQVRLAEEEDFDSIREIFHAGLTDGHVRAGDTGADIDNLQEGYFSDEGDSGFWVARQGDIVVGMIGVQKTSENIAEIRRLRVLESHRRRGIGTELLRTALKFCRQRGYLRVILDVKMDAEPAIQLFKKQGFTLHRQQEVDGRIMMDFLLDLYSVPEEEVY